MKNQYIYGIIIASTALIPPFSSCSSDMDAPEKKLMHTPKPLTLTPQTRAVASDLNDFYMDFTTDMTTHIDSDNNLKDKNVVVSPISTAMVLGMVANGVDDITKNEITGYLGTENISALNALCKMLLDELPVTDNLTELCLANSFWINKGSGKTVKKAYASLISEEYKSEILQFDTEIQEIALKEINGWCSDKTNGLIPSFMEVLGDNFLAIALNALYFNSPWNEDFFSPEDTEPAIFHGMTKESEVMMMNMPERPYGYAFNDSFELVTLPLGNSTFYLRIILPKEGVSMHEATESLSKENMLQLMRTTENVKLTLYLPKFKIEGKYRISDMFETIGMTNMSGMPGLTMFDPEIPGIIRFHQAASFCIDETGAEAAAVSSGEILDSAPLHPEPGEAYTMRVDRPFFFYIEEFSTGACILSGRIADL